MWNARYWQGTNFTQTDASVHLLRFSRWLSLELCISYIDASVHVNQGGTDGLSPQSWGLTIGNRTMAREEMENLVLDEPIEKSLEGSVYLVERGLCYSLVSYLKLSADSSLASFSTSAVR
jgi:hypothetical protein